MRAAAVCLAACLAACVLARPAAADVHFVVDVAWRPATGDAQLITLMPGDGVKFQWTGVHSLWLLGGYVEPYDENRAGFITCWDAASLASNNAVMLVNTTSAAGGSYALDFNLSNSGETWYFVHGDQAQCNLGYKRAVYTNMYSPPPS
eukprot:CAMPEP_0197576160 /NCGR_PEP_ID=MMETSP1326-20131121/1282_1 /TAXON_ID=1155430 /ORGANISM="Genus nov. species nov., Strain RCC2288" /LENGTH=147 /DNA_ID=CAMNT_0043139023 /DNA_START=43 /DNA_END=482 /DNA_ORIENTATION=-